MSKSTVLAATPVVTFNVEALQALGVETKISKADLMEYITSNIEEQLKAAEKVSLENLYSYGEDYLARKKKACDTFSMKVMKNPKVKDYWEASKAFALAKITFEGTQPHTEEEEQKSFLNQIVSVTNSGRNKYVMVANNGSHGSLYANEKLIFKCEKINLTQEFVLYSGEEFDLMGKTYNQTDREYEKIREDLRNLSTHAKAARMAMLKSILSGTAEGKNLLSFLDSRARNYKALSAATTTTEV
jgi:hypothetical protein